MGGTKYELPKNAFDKNGVCAQVLLVAQKIFPNIMALWYAFLRAEWEKLIIEDLI